MHERKVRDPLICFGTGLIALDIVTGCEEEEMPRVWAGGSCGNVLTILSYLGWESYPVARLGKDEAAKVITRDMSDHGVKFDYVKYDMSVQTPIIVEKILMTTDGQPTHRFYWTCPDCGNWLPRYSPIRLKDIRDFCEETPSMKCFYFDRVSPASLRLAEEAKQQGALVVFEPTSLKDDRKFSKAMELCDILKYSNEGTKSSPEVAYNSPAKIVVETLGTEGLRYRLRTTEKGGDWKVIAAFPVRKLKDAAGAGDWCTAGLIHMLITSQACLKSIGERDVVEALRYGQALSALNCGFEGARGCMNEIKGSQFDKKVQLILDREEAIPPTDDSLRKEVKKVTQCVCPACQERRFTGESKSSKMNVVSVIRRKRSGM